MSHAIAWNCPSCGQPGKLAPPSLREPGIWLCVNPHCGYQNTAPMSDDPTGAKPLTKCLLCGHPHWKHLSGSCRAEYVAERAGYCGCSYFTAAADSRDTRVTPELLAQRFHETYERLAPSFGYATREASAKPWADVPENNRRLMIAVCAEILADAEEASKLPAWAVAINRAYDAQYRPHHAASVPEGQ